MDFSFILKMLLAAITVFFSGFSAGGKDVCMIGHRGMSGIYPDNTEIAFEMAAKHGAGGAETDVRITKDGIYVCSHDDKAELSNGSVLVIADSTYEQLTAKPLKGTLGKAYLCTYKKYLEIMKDNNMICFIELKGEFDDSQIKEIFTIADEIYDIQKCILQSFNFENLINARKIVPDLPMMLTYGNGDGDYSKCFEYNFSIDAEYSAIDEEMVKAFHDRGLQVAAWTANTPVQLGYCKSLGVDYIESDFFMK